MGRRVLIVDDSAFSRALTQTLAADAWPGASIEVAADGAEALACAERFEPEVVLCDHSMPGMTGLELIAALRAAGIEAEVALVTANLQEALRAEAEEAGVRFVEKPITREKIGLLAREIEGGLLAHLSQDERDAFGEIFNLGAGLAARGLSQLLGREIAFRVPSIVLLGVVDAQRYVATRMSDDLCVVQEDFSGAFDGVALLMFTRDGAGELIRTLMPDALIDDPMAAEAADVLTEVGNVVINACLSSFADLLDDPIARTVPVLTRTTPERLAALARPSGLVLIVRVAFKVAGQGIEALTNFMLSIDSMTAFRRATERLMVKAAS